METVLDQIGNAVSAYVPNLMGALAILVVGWIVAAVVSSLVRAAIKRTGLSGSFGRWFGAEKGGAPPDVASWVGRAVYYLILLFVLMAFFQALQITVITEPLTGLLNQAFQYLPLVLGAATLALIAWILATVLRIIVVKALRAVNTDARFSSMAGDGGPEPVALSQTIGEAVFWLVLLLFLPAILSTLGLVGLLLPVQNMISELLGFLPNLFAAGLILLVGWFVAHIVRRIVVNLSVAIGVDRASERAGLAQALGTMSLSRIIGLIVYALILLPVLIASLDALGQQSITRPASNMLNTLLGAVPSMFAAVLILVLSYFVGRIVAGFVTNILAGIGFDTVPARLGLGGKPVVGERSLSQVAGLVVLVAIMLFAVAEAARQLAFFTLNELVGQFIVLTGQVILGLIVFGFGLYLANLASTAVRPSGAPHATLLAHAARISILVLAGAMALRQMGLANEIVTLGFGLLVGAVAVAVALAFGLGGREAAGREVERWFKSFHSDNEG